MNLKQQLAAREPLLGTFQKSTHYHNTEVLSKTSLDVICLDAEHAPFSREALDTCVLAAKANAKPILIRVPDDQPATLLNALDIGATGVVIPHVKTADQLKFISEHCYFGDGGRGYAGSSRFAGYTTSKLPENLERNRQETCVIAQIEDLAALDDLEPICESDNVDALFIGTMDLTVALGASSPKEDKVQQVINQIIAVASGYNKTLGMFVGDLAELPRWKAKGVSLFLLGSDHSFMLSGAAGLRAVFDEE